MQVKTVPHGGENGLMGKGQPRTCTQWAEVVAGQQRQLKSGGEAMQLDGWSLRKLDGDNGQRLLVGELR